MTSDSRSLYLHSVALHAAVAQILGSFSEPVLIVGPDNNLFGERPLFIDVPEDVARFVVVGGVHGLPYSSLNFLPAGTILQLSLPLTESSITRVVVATESNLPPDFLPFVPRVLTASFATYSDLVTASPCDINLTWSRDAGPALMSWTHPPTVPSLPVSGSSLADLYAAGWNLPI